MGMEVKRAGGKHGKESERCGVVPELRESLDL